jgi:hypothetical protein
LTLLDGLALAGEEVGGDSNQAGKHFQLLKGPYAFSFNERKRMMGEKK